MLLLTLYLDIGFEPHFPFGFGLGYTTFEYNNLQLSKNEIAFGENLEIKITISNTGSRDGVETVQLFVQDVVGSITRPVRELKRFEKVAIKKGEKKEVTFTISSEDLKFVNNKMELKAESGKFNIWVGANSSSISKKSFHLID